jgi:hypothetical protein
MKNLIRLDSRYDPAGDHARRTPAIPRYGTAWLELLALLGVFVGQSARSARHIDPPPAA